MIDVGLVVIGYLVGSISSAILVCRILKLGDPRQDGSGNPGATNVLRLAGKVPAVATLLGDWLKGTLPVVLAWLVTSDAVIIAASGLAAFFGHLYPVYFRFQGGKGVATGLGVLLAWSPVALAATALTWVVMVAAFRYSSLGAIAAFAMAPAFMLWTTEDPVLTAATAIITVAAIWRHRENIVRLATGEESQIGKSSD
jgi:glycerol-3-phosphate acyltransferase PlsY